jgi:hypothetical protein
MCPVKMSHKTHKQKEWVRECVWAVVSLILYQWELHVRQRWLSSGLEAASTSETLVNFYQNTRRYNPEDSHLRTHRRENLKPYLTTDRSMPERKMDIFTPVLTFRPSTQSL